NKFLLLLYWSLPNRAGTVFVGENGRGLCKAGIYSKFMIAQMNSVDFTNASYILFNSLPAASY
ncbi:MAG: hypothetical protein LBL15_04550, partial [Oscillospiraceae bacterium]|nr:hypothetical protein [Oscillospiraceae bacterium]